MTAELERFGDALEVFCRSLSERIVHLAEDHDVMSLRLVHGAVAKAVGDLLEIELEVEDLISRG